MSNYTYFRDRDTNKPLNSRHKHWIIKIFKCHMKHTSYTFMRVPKDIFPRYKEEIKS